MRSTERRTIRTLADLRERLELDDEITRDTEPAHDLVDLSVKEARAAGEIHGDFDPGRDVAEAGAEKWVYANGYITDVVGQSSATGNGKQGLHPERLAGWREVAEDTPVRIVFVEHGAKMWEEVWLGRGGEMGLEIQDIQMTDRTAKRQGWWKRDLREARGRITFPYAAPPKDDPTKFGRLDV